MVQGMPTLHDCQRVLAWLTPFLLLLLCANFKLVNFPYDFNLFNLLMIKWNLDLLKYTTTANYHFELLSNILSFNLNQTMRPLNFAMSLTILLSGTS